METTEITVSVNGGPEQLHKNATYDTAAALLESVILSAPSDYSIIFTRKKSNWIQFFYEDNYLNIALCEPISEETDRLRYGCLVDDAGTSDIINILYEFYTGSVSSPDIDWDDSLEEYSCQSSSTSGESTPVPSNNQGCYVATCIYGSYNCAPVWTLRRYRDNALARSWYGRLFIRTYYIISPLLVSLFGNAKWFRRFWKIILDAMVAKLQAGGYKSTPYKDKIW